MNDKKKDPDMSLVEFDEDDFVGIDFDEVESLGFKNKSLKQPDNITKMKPNMSDALEERSSSDSINDIDDFLMDENLQSNNINEEANTVNQKDSLLSFLPPLSRVGVNSKTMGIVSVATLVAVIGGLSWYSLKDSGSNSAGFNIDPVANNYFPATEQVVSKMPNNINQIQVQPVSDSPTQTQTQLNELVSLLSDYPTASEVRDMIEDVRGVEVSAEEMDVFLLAVKNNSDNIDALRKSKDVNQQVLSAIDEMRATVKEAKILVGEQNGKIADLQNKIYKLSKNSGWYHNRLNRLEGGNIAPAATNNVKSPSKPAAKPTVKAPTKPASSSTSQPAKRLELSSSNSWVVSGASTQLAFITNVNSGKRLRVTRGFDIPGCGQVVGINPKDQEVITMSCKLSSVD